ncbi:hypothetical protein SAMN06265375_102166 [Muriicola jejuensis]|uniref:Uncharacterized protein n=1 Tax=Muriicola jejuensis TaxID=504488 RepID=A0A6P0UE09_9FLAO|nr:hypothetical protein [Muriicola jejuensis]NER10852.1 hypothetical protein [Muriicola jejuensis]SMP15928.1 hypothetical protein SAMN06265375_102166 [Muriicola jejuensis]
MKIHTSIKFLFGITLAIFMSLTLISGLHAQSEKNSVRIKADYTKVMDGQSYLDIKVISRIDRQMVDVPDLDMEVYYEYDYEEFPLGSAKTDMSGKSRFMLPPLSEMKADSTGMYTLGVSFGGNDEFKRGSRTVNFRDARIETRLEQRDSTNYVEATLTDTGTGLPVPDVSLRVQVQRLIRPLRIGEEFNYTDENGTVFVPVEAGIPGLDGLLNIEVVLPESEDYGTVKAIVEAPYGKPIVLDTSFNERTLWSPRSKTPIFIVIFTILLIVVTWGPILYLIRNLYKISKS